MLLTLHALVYVAVNVLLVLLWLMLGGDWAGASDPLAAARGSGFWPFWVMAVWGVALALHAALVVVVRSRRRSRRRDRAEAAGAGNRSGTRWVAAMFTDIVGSTALAARLGDADYADVLVAHRRTVREVIAAADGREVGTQGDGFLVTFASPRQATACAVALQRRLAEDRDDADRVPHVRIGVHAGEVHERDGDVVGQVVNVAARVADSAGPDEVVVTETVAEHAPADVAVDDRGVHQLEGLPTPRHLLTLRWHG
ncbi:MAG TPA: adenylate/guanylate cyclase domain-containing protein [Egicoccus sp.]|nr:adenylate/guanylate cyclase domain-containing protein [Egicoccus sp.]HSK24988.1 adenylate/guanylate cyclase domain-containing protein [Egicoccus sp.]